MLSTNTNPFFWVLWNSIFIFPLFIPELSLMVQTGTNRMSSMNGTSANINYVKKIMWSSSVSKRRILAIGLTMRKLLMWFIILHIFVLSALRHLYSCDFRDTSFLIRFWTHSRLERAFVLLSEENKKSEPFSYREKVRIFIVWCE